MNQALFLFTQLAILLATSHFISRTERSLMRSDNLENYKHKTQANQKGMKEEVQYLVFKDSADKKWDPATKSRKYEKTPLRIVYVVTYKTPRPIVKTPTSDAVF